MLTIPTPFLSILPRTRHIRHNMVCAKALGMKYVSKKEKAAEAKKQKAKKKRIAKQKRKKEKAVEKEKWNKEKNGIANHSEVTTVMEDGDAPRKAPRPGRTSRYTGVTRIKGRKDSPWRARIRVNGNDQFLGHYVSERVAAEAFDVAALYYRGEKAAFNFPIEDVRRFVIPEILQKKILQDCDRGSDDGDGSSDDFNLVYRRLRGRRPKKTKTEERNNYKRVDAVKEEKLPRRKKERSQYTGVVRHREYKDHPWGAQNHYDGSTRSLGSYATEQEAAKAFDAAAVNLTSRDENMRLNFGVKRARSFEWPLQLAELVGGKFDESDISNDDVMETLPKEKRDFEAKRKKEKTPTTTTRRKRLSQYIGVSRRNDSSWYAQIVERGKHYHLGTYAVEREAAEAFDAAALYFRGRKANLNFGVVQASTFKLPSRIAKLFPVGSDNIVGISAPSMPTEVAEEIEETGGQAGPGAGSMVASPSTTILTTPPPPSFVGFQNATRIQQESQYFGVSRSGEASKPWKAHIYGRGDRPSLSLGGSFASELEAAEASDAAALYFLGEKAAFNFSLEKARNFLIPEVLLNMILSGQVGPRRSPRSKNKRSRSVLDEAGDDDGTFGNISSSTSANNTICFEHGGNKRRRIDGDAVN